MSKAVQLDLVELVQALNVDHTPPYVECGLDCDLENNPSLTIQSEADACDINKIMAQWAKTGLLPHVNRFPGSYGDFSDASDYQTALNRVIEAQDAFMELPAAIRTKFDNDPGKFLEFASNPENAQEMINLGLATPLPDGVVSVAITNPEALHAPIDDDTTPSSSKKGKA